MKLLLGSQVLCALVAALAAGVGVQTYAFVQAPRQLSAAGGEQAAELPETAAAATPSGPCAATPDAPDPIEELADAEARMRSLFDGFYERFDRPLGRSWVDEHPFFVDGESFRPGLTPQLGPHVDLQDRGGHYEMRVDHPEAGETDVLVRIEDDMLVVEGSRSSTIEQAEPGSLVRRERRAGRFEQRLSLPHDADPAFLRTEYEDGVLRVMLMKGSEKS